MDKLLIVMDQAHRHQKALAQGIELARATGAQLEIVAFTHEHPGRWPGTKGYLITHIDQPPFHQLDLYWSYVQ